MDPAARKHADKTFEFTSEEVRTALREYVINHGLVSKAGTLEVRLGLKGAKDVREVLEKHKKLTVCASIYWWKKVELLAERRRRRRKKVLR